MRASRASSRHGSKQCTPWRASQAKRRWLLQLWQLELRRELIDESATYVLQPESPAPSDEEARAARVQLCMAKFERERSDLLASEQLLLGQ